MLATILLLVVLSPVFAVIGLGVWLCLPMPEHRADEGAGP